MPGGEGEERGKGATVLVELFDERGDLILDLSLQRRGGHPPSASPGQVIQRARRLLGTVSVDAANISHGVPTFRLTAVGLDQPVRYAAFVLRPIHDIQV